MWKTALFLNKKPIFENLSEYGFLSREGEFVFSADIMEAAFGLDVCVSESGMTKLRVIDTATGEEYTLVNNPSAIGSFVGAVRTECEEILNDIISKCYEPDIFKSEYALLVIQYIRDKYGAEAEYLWEKFPKNAIFREKKTKKWFAALLTVEKRKIGINEDGTIEIIDLKDTPDNIGELVDGKNYLAGYHMNKKHWYTICLDGCVPIEEIYGRIDISFDTLKKRK